MTFDFPGVTLSSTAEFVLLQSMRPLFMLSSAIAGGGLITASRIFNRHVDKSYRGDDPVAEQIAFAQAHGVQPPFVGLMTAVYLDKTRTATRREGDLTVTAVVTAGVGNATCAGVSVPMPPVPIPGTINIIVLVDGNLTPAALVNAVITTTEVKTHMLLERNVRTPDGLAATGTSTDAVVIACTGRGDPLPYAGPLTLVGSLIGQCVRASLQEALP
jgi:iron complex transport system ATP-binding protein